MEQQFMKEKKIFPLVLSMSLPMVLSMLVNSLYNIVDSYFIARVSESAMAALSLVYPIQIIITAISVGLGIGVNAMISYFLGANDSENASTTTSWGIVLSIVHGLILTIVCTAIMPHFLAMFTKNKEVISLGITYSNIAFAFSITVTVGIALEKIFQAMGKMKISMICMSVGFIANIALDPLLIFGIGIFPRMGMAGAALATGIGQALSALAYILFYFIEPLPVKIRFRNLHFQGAIIGKIYAIGIPAALNMALPSILISALNGILSTFADAYVVALGAYYKLQTFIYLPANGIIQGIRPLVGYNYGAGEYKRVRNIFYTALALASAIMLAGLLLCWIAPGMLIQIFTSTPETIAIGTKALRIISLGFIFFLRFCYLLWCFGRARCRNAISVHFASPLSGHHPSCRTAFYPLSGCYRCMDCLSVYGNTHCMLCMDHLSAKNTAYVPLRTFAVFFLLCYG